MVKTKTTQNRPHKNVGTEHVSMGSLLYPQSSIPHLATTVIAAVLIWMALRLWWSFQPVWILPAILGLFLAISLKQSDLPVVSIIVSVLSAALFPLNAVPTTLTILLSASIMIGVSTMALLLVNDSWRRIIPYVVLSVILLGFFSHGLEAQRTVGADGYALVDALNYNPPAEEYSFDAFIFTKTFYLMEEEKGYYTAFGEAIVGDGRLDSVPTSALGWRMPTIFYIWHLFFSNGEQIGLAFLFVAMIAALMAFLSARTLANDSFAILPAALICGYFFFAASSLWIVFFEYWGLMVALAAIYLFVSGRTVAAAVFAVIAPLFRELYIFALAAGFLSELAHRSFRKTLIWAMAGLSFITLYSLHYFNVKSIVSLTPAAWLVGGGWKLTLDSIMFSMNYIVETPSTAVLLYVLGLLGLFSVTQSKNKVFLVFLATASPIAFVFIGNEWNYYWGVSFMPLAFLGFAPGLAALEKLLTAGLKELGLSSRI